MEQIMSELLKNKNEYEKKQKELAENNKYFCPMCKIIKPLSEKSKGRNMCHICHKQKRNIRNKELRTLAK